MHLTPFYRTRLKYKPIPELSVCLLSILGNKNKFTSDFTYDGLSPKFCLAVAILTIPEKIKTHFFFSSSLKYYSSNCHNNNYKKQYKSINFQLRPLRPELLY